jgi:hypothetical protein
MFIAFLICTGVPAHIYNLYFMRFLHFLPVQVFRRTYIMFSAFLTCTGVPARGAAPEAGTAEQHHAQQPQTAAAPALCDEAPSAACDVRHPHGVCQKSLILIHPQTALIRA